jgi:DNA-directed RNA polymerase N-terminal
MGCDCHSFDHRDATLAASLKEWGRRTGRDLETAELDTMIASERAWEIEGQERGIARYRRHIEKAQERLVKTDGRAGGMTDTEGGSLIVRRVLVPLANAIYAQQILGQRELMEGGGRPPAWAKQLMMLTADEWAVITIRTVLTGFAPSGDDARPVTSVALNIGSNGKLQVEFNRWKEAEAERAKEARKTNTNYVNLFQLMKHRVKSVDKKTARKWMKLSERLERMSWDRDERSHVGSALIQLLVDHAGGWFTLVMVPSGSQSSYRNERHLVLTPEAKKVLHSYEEMTELQRPLLVPMRQPPVPWRWTDEDPDAAQAPIKRSRRTASLQTNPDPQPQEAGETAEAPQA